MKTFNDPTLAAIDGGTAIATGAVAIYCDPPVLVWGGYGPLTLTGTGPSGENETFAGIGDRGLAQASAGALGGAAQGVTLQLSGIDPEALELLDADEVRQAPCVVRRLIASGDGRTILGAYVFDRGRVDQLLTEEEIGGKAVLRALIENAARGLGRRGARMRTDADQRLVKANDGFFRNVSYAAEKTLYWGGLRPARAGSVLPADPGGGRPSETSPNQN